MAKELPSASKTRLQIRNGSICERNMYNLPSILTTGRNSARLVLISRIFRAGEEIIKPVFTIEAIITGRYE